MLGEVETMLRATPEGEELLEELRDPIEFAAQARARRMAQFAAMGGEAVTVE